MVSADGEFRGCGDNMRATPNKIHKPDGKFGGTLEQDPVCTYRIQRYFAFGYSGCDNPQNLFFYLGRSYLP